MHRRYPFGPALFQAIVEQTPDAVICADLDGVIWLWNLGAEAEFGFAADEVRGTRRPGLHPCP